MFLYVASGRKICLRLILVLFFDFGEEDGEHEDDEDDEALLYCAVVLSFFSRLRRGDFRYTTMLFHIVL